MTASREQMILACIAEEAAEVAQMAIKNFRFGPSEVFPGQEQTNAERFAEEVCDLLTLIDMVPELNEAMGNIDPVAWARKKRAKFNNYAAYSASLGLMTTQEASE